MTDETSADSPSAGAGLRGIGPAIIVASVVLGPGSILTSSKVGSEYGYSMAWVLVAAGLLMVGMVALAGRLGVLLKGTVCDELTSRLGRPVAALIGIVLFLVVAAFQSSNNIAVVTAVEPLMTSSADADGNQAADESSDSSESAEESGSDRWLPVGILIALNVAIIAALYGLKSLYIPVERLMKLLVAAMMIGFAGNVFFAKPSLSELGKGLVPQLPSGDDVLPLLGLVATTFSVGGAFYQAYLVREKGWTTANLKQGLFDSAVGISVLCGTTLVIMMTSAAVFAGKGIELTSAADVGQQLEPLFGAKARILFSLGLLAGAISSFMVNAMIGGAVMADGFGLGWSMDQKWPKAFTVMALLIGMGVAIAATAFKVSRVGLIVFAQALTVVGVPLLAISLLFLGIAWNVSSGGNDSRQRIPGWIIGLAVAGTAMTDRKSGG